MKSLIVAVALLLATPAHAAPAQKWFLETTLYPVDNRGGVHWDSPQKKKYLNHAFDTSSECRTRWRVFRKQCAGLIADNEDAEGSGFDRKFTGVCRRFRQQPEPVLKVPDITIDSADDFAWLLKHEQECAK
jgi:hypothetical protein